MRLPSSIFVSVSLFTAETTAALYLSSTYRSAGDQIWQGLTLLFTLVPSVLVQLTLTFIHRDLSRDRPLVLLLHILQLGPVVRSVLAPYPPVIQLCPLITPLKVSIRVNLPSALRTCACFHSLRPFFVVVPGWLQTCTGCRD